MMMKQTLNYQWVRLCSNHWLNKPQAAISRLSLTTSYWFDNIDNNVIVKCQCQIWENCNWFEFIAICTIKKEKYTKIYTTYLFLFVTSFLWKVFFFKLALCTYIRVKTFLWVTVQFFIIISSLLLFQIII